MSHSVTKLNVALYPVLFESCGAAIPRSQAPMLRLLNVAQRRLCVILDAHHRGVDGSGILGGEWKLSSVKMLQGVSRNSSSPSI